MFNYQCWFTFGVFFKRQRCGAPGAHDETLSGQNCYIPLDPDLGRRGQIEPDEMGAIVKCLSDVKNIGEGRTEEMPPDRQAVSQLERPEMVNKETNLIESCQDMDSLTGDHQFPYVKYGVGFEPHAVVQAVIQ